MPEICAPKRKRDRKTSLPRRENVVELENEFAA
jgi:hypothetical protein